MRYRLRESGQRRKISARSAGTRASQPGHRPDARAQKVMSGAGVSLAGIKARQVTARDLVRSDYILAMDSSNYSDLLKICPPEHHFKIQLLMSYSPKLGLKDVPDPYFGVIAGFEEVFRLVDAAVSQLILDITGSTD